MVMGQVRSQLPHPEQVSTFFSNRTGLNFCKQMHQAQHGTEHAEKPFFKKDPHQKPCGKHHGDQGKAHGHAIGEVDMHMGKIPGKHGQDHPARADLAKRDNPVRMQSEIRDGQGQNHHERQKDIFYGFQGIALFPGHDHGPDAQFFAYPGHPVLEQTEGADPGAPHFGQGAETRAGTARKGSVSPSRPMKK